MVASRQRRIYRERLRPSSVFVILWGSLILMVSVAYAAAVDVRWGLLIALVSVVLSVFASVLTGPVVEVIDPEDSGDRMLHVGAASISLRHVDQVSSLSSKDLEIAHKGLYDFTAFRMVRGSGAIVELHIVDPEDPHSRWLISTRDPDALVRALSATPTL